MGWFSCWVRDVWTEKQEHCAEVRQRDREITVSAASEHQNAFGLIATLFRHSTTQLQEWTLHGTWMWSRGCSHSEKRCSTRLPKECQK